jgi:hypothetical protein
MRVIARLTYRKKLRSSPMDIKMNYDANEKIAFRNDIMSTSLRLVYRYELIPSAVDVVLS